MPSRIRTQIGIADHAIRVILPLDQQLLPRRDLAELAHRRAGDHADRPVEAFTVKREPVETITHGDDEALFPRTQSHRLIGPDVFKLAIRQHVQNGGLLRGFEPGGGRQLRAGWRVVLHGHLTECEVNPRNKDSAVVGRLLRMAHGSILHSDGTIAVPR